MTARWWIAGGAVLSLAVPSLAFAQTMPGSVAPVAVSPVAVPPDQASLSSPPSPVPGDAGQLAQGQAKDKPKAAEANLDTPAERRSGVVFGAVLGAGAIDVTGYPNSASHLGVNGYHHNSGAVAGFASRFFLMGALADTFNVGVWFGGISGENSSDKASARGGGFRVEAFPLYAVSPRLRDLGLSLQLGVGTAVADKKDKSLSVDGTESFIGGGPLWEISHNKLIGLNATTGISLEYQFVTSQSIASHGVMLGARIAFYGGP